MIVVINQPLTNTLNTTLNETKFIKLSNINREVNRYVENSIILTSLKGYSTSISYPHYHEHHLPFFQIFGRYKQELIYKPNI